MNDELLALLVHNQAESFRALDQALLGQGIRTEHARSCSEASATLRRSCLPRLIFTDPNLTDGTWADVLTLARMHGRVIPVIVVSRLVDIDLYLRTLEGGATDFIVPPLSPADVAHVVKMAIGERRAASA